MAYNRINISVDPEKISEKGHKLMRILLILLEETITVISATTYRSIERIFLVKAAIHWHYINKFTRKRIEGDAS